MTVFVNLDYNEDTIIILFATVLSLVSTFLILLFIYLDSFNTKRSYNLQLIFRLLLSNFGLCIVVLAYFLIVRVGHVDEKLACAIYQPIPLFFFLASFGWTLMIAFRFRNKESGDKTSYIPPIPFWSIWAMALVLVLPAAIANASDFPGTSHFEPQYYIQGCTFNHKTTLGKTVDIITFQSPLVVTILVNISSYLVGLWALRDSPHSVVARQMNRAGGYLFVLVIVWVPNFTSNILAMYTNSNNAHPSLFETGVCLSVLQGFMNVCVYVWSNKNIRLYLFHTIWHGDICCRSDQRNSTSNSSTITPIQPQQSSKMSWLLTNSSFSEHENEPFDPADASEAGGKSSSLSDHSAHSNQSSQSKSSSSNRSSHGGNMMGILKNTRDSFLLSSTRSNTKANKGGGQGLAGGAQATANPMTQAVVAKKTQPLTIEQLDTEKYVRFGETTTRIISPSRFSSMSTSTVGGAEDVVCSDDDSLRESSLDEKAFP